MTLQTLESRVTPVGQITVNWTQATGLLVITGDDNANGLTLSVTPTEVTVDPDANNKVNSGGDGVAVPFTGLVKSIKVDLKGGNDSIDINTTQSFNVPGAVSILLGDGDNTLDFTTNSTITLGALAVKAGDGKDTLTIQGGINQLSKITGAAHFNFGSGGHTTTLGDVEFGATLRVLAGDAVGNANDFAATTVRVAKPTSLDMNNSFPGIASFTDCTLGGLLMKGQSIGAVLAGTEVTGVVSLIAGYDASLSVDTSIIAGNVLLKAPSTNFEATGDGTTITGNLTAIATTIAQTQFQSTTLTEVKGNVFIRGGWYNDEFTANSQFKAKNVILNLLGGDNTVAIGDTAATTSIAGTLTIKSGNGRDSISLARTSVTGAVLMLTLGGNDLISIESATTFSSTFTADTGSGNDTISIAQDPTGDVGEVSLAGAVKIKAGVGDDTLLLGLLVGGDSDSRVRFIAPINSIDGGLGVDTFQPNSQIVGVAVAPIGWNP